VLEGPASELEEKETERVGLPMKLDQSVAELVGLPNRTFPKLAVSDGNWIGVRGAGRENVAMDGVAKERVQAKKKKNGRRGVKENAAPRGKETV